jgi:pimeloyl-ACP methyl ester carboxylesterase
MEEMKTIVLLAACGAPLFAQQASFEGKWMGALDAGGQTLRIGLNISRDASTALKATMDSVDQGAMGIPIDSVSVEQDRLKFSIARIGGSYQGVMKDGKIEGTWSQGGGSMPLVFARGVNLEGPRRPQEDAVKQGLYRSEDVTVKSGDVALAGTLTIPNGDGRFPAVLLVTGSGPQDRDETILGHKPFLILADHLTKAGFAVLRLDDRGVGQSGGVYRDAGMEEFTGDALAAVKWLQARKEVTPAKVGIIGHSEGGTVGPLAASRSKDVAFVVMLSGMGLSFEDVLYQQGTDLMRASGAPESVIAANRKVQERMFAILREEPDLAKAQARMIAYARETKDSPPQLSAAVEQQAPRFATNEMRSLLLVDVPKTLEAVKCPVLAVFGEKDLQVSADANLPAVAAALAKGRNPNFAVVKLPGLNHLYQTAKTGGIDEYAKIEETFAPVALKTIADWLTAVAK